MQQLIAVAETLAQKYEVVVTNPPYMGAGNMNPKLSGFIKKKYADYKSDFFSAFIIRASEMTKSDGYCGFFTPYVWMFIQSYEKLRKYLYLNATIETLIQFEYSAFEEATVPVCTFVFKNSKENKKGCYLRLVDFRGGMEVQRQKTLEAIANHNCGFYYEQCSDNFAKIPGAPVAYWVSEQTIDSFQKGILANIADTKQGFATGDNNRFLKLWQEVSWSKVGLNCDSREMAKDSLKKWFPTNKGGSYRKWYGNNIYLANWENDGYEMREFRGSVIRNPQYYFRQGITWSSLSSGGLSMRFSPKGFIFESKGSMCYLKSDADLFYVLALMNTKVVDNMLKILAPTLDYHEGPMSKVPVVIEYSDKILIEKKAKECVDFSKSDWDSFETSWDFTIHPLLSAKHELLADAYASYKQIANERFAQLKANEEELNRIFIDIYGLQDELTPEVEEKDVTVHRIFDSKDDVPEAMKGSNYILTQQQVVKSLISYAVGCMFGRYSLDKPGLVYAGGEWDAGNYQIFAADKDAIIPISDNEYFNDDIVARFVEFIKTAFGADEKTLEANLNFIAIALGGNGSARDVIRAYFNNGFYADHCKTYQKRPIYWLFDSGKKNGFKCLIYMHRYQKDTIARIRTDYLHEQQSRYRTAISDLQNRIDNAASTGVRVKLQKQLATVQAQVEEARLYEEKIHHLADQMLEIDLNDGVKHNYAIFKDVLAKIK